jgi:hypothetical protein
MVRIFAVLLHRLPVMLCTLDVELIIILFDPVATLLQPTSFLFKLGNVGIWMEIGPRSSGTMSAVPGGSGMGLTWAKG